MTLYWCKCPTDVVRWVDDVLSLQDTLQVPLIHMHSTVLIPKIKQANAWVLRCGSFRFICKKVSIPNNISFGRGHHCFCFQLIRLQHNLPSLGYIVRSSVAPLSLHIHEKYTLCYVLRGLCCPSSRVQQPAADKMACWRTFFKVWTC